MSEPIQVYPDPDGGGRTQSTVPVDSTTAVAGTASGAVATGSLLLGSGNTVVAFLQMAYQGGVQPDGRLGVTAIPMPYVTVAIIFGALSVLLWGIALVRGFQMKKKAMELSYAICDLGKKNGLFDKYFKSDKVA
ncbi:MAG TPA: hypothetical protein VJ725_05815 [Thermoanaerobaculia bacterium]|nr:hypothetical protein [Thermoanaerobaculia bacterium]